MDLTVKCYHGLPCATEVFKINGIAAEIDDFGENTDFGRDKAEPYCCGNHYFKPYRKPPEGTLDKYHITRDEYDQVCDKLEDVLAVGECGWCS